MPRRQGDLEAVFALTSPTFSPDGKYLALGWHQSVRVFELATRQEVRAFAGSSGPVAWAPDGRTIASAEGTSILTWDVTGRAPDGRLREGRLDPGALRSRWDDLSSEDAARAHRGVWALTASARQSVPFLRERLLRRPAGGDKQIRQWVADLDSDQFAARQKATDELKKLGRFAEPALRRALRGDPPLEPRRRIEQLLKQLAAPAQKRRAARVTQVLEQVGTPEARRLLQALAREEAEVPLTREAQSALRRLERWGAKP